MDQFWKGARGRVEWNDAAKPVYVGNIPPLTNIVELRRAILASQSVVVVAVAVLEARSL